MITYKDFMKHAEMITKATNDAQLKGIMHYDDGSVAVTDSHRLYFAERIHDRGEVLLSPKGQRINESYLEVKRLFPTNHPKHKVVFKVDDLLQAADIIYAVAKHDSKSKHNTLELKDSHAVFINKDVTAAVKVSEDPFDFRLLLNSKYLLEAMHLVKATGCKEITVSFYSAVSPVLFEVSNLKVIILPVRRY